MANINFKNEHEGFYSKTWRDYKRILNLKEGAQHGKQLEKKDLNRVPMIRRDLPLT